MSSFFSLVSLLENEEGKNWHTYLWRDTKVIVVVPSYEANQSRGGVVRHHQNWRLQSLSSSLLKKEGHRQTRLCYQTGNDMTKTVLATNKPVLYSLWILDRMKIDVPDSLEIVAGFLPYLLPVVPIRGPTACKTFSNKKSANRDRLALLAICCFLGKSELRQDQERRPAD